MERINMYRIVVIDDEDDAIGVVTKSLHFLTSFSLKIVGTANDLVTGVEVIRKSKPDIVFLDVEMPGENGLKIYDFFEEPEFKVIFVTAFNKYALDALKKSALDYLLKPFGIVELKEAIQKAIKIIEKDRRQVVISDKISDLSALPVPGKKIVLDVEEGLVIESTNNIEYCYANQSYSTIVTLAQKEIIVTKSLKQLEELIADQNFYRTHKSYLVNIQYITKYVRIPESYVMLKSGTRIPVSSRKTAKVTQELKKLLLP